MSDGRRFTPVLECRAEVEDGTVTLFPPRPGLYRDAPAAGAAVNGVGRPSARTRPLKSRAK